MTDKMQLRNVGVFAHVDAGKTTTTEYMLYMSGKTRSIGRVDAGTAQTDWLDVEKERGISVRAATTAFVWKDCRINLVDTPGHVDFLSEVERALRVMDGAILLVSAAEGVQAQTEVIWSALRSMGIPTLIFVNKMDREGAEANRVVAEIRRTLTESAIAVQTPIGEGPGFTGFVHGHEELYERLAEHDEELVERYIGGEETSEAELEERLRVLVREARVFPILFGASIRGIGVAELLDAVVRYLPPPREIGDDKPVSGVVFKMERDKMMGRVAHIRLYQGELRNRDLVYNASQDIREKVTQIRKIHANHHEDIGVLGAGDIAAVCGFQQVRIGDIIGSSEAVPAEHRLAVPLMTVKVDAAKEEDYSRLAAALQELSDEDPLLDLQWLQDERELHVKVMGPIQLEVLASILKSRFGLDAVFGEPTIIYKETPAKSGEGYVAYTMPKPCWAILRFHIEPGERGSGLVYASEARAENILQRYQNEVERRVPEALQQGLRGWEVTDLKVTLTYGEHHVWHTHPLDFAVATPMGIMDGLANVSTTLLEPMLRIRITVPEEIGGRLLSDLMLLRAEVDSPVVAGGRLTVEGDIPAATSLDYPVQLAALSGGRAAMTTRFSGYRECPPGFEASRKRRGVNPLDRSKYILSVRNALSHQ